MENFGGDFQKRWDGHERRFNTVFNLTIIIILLVLLGYLIIGSIMLKVATNVGEQIRQHGLKSTVEEVWYGEDGAK